MLGVNLTFDALYATYASANCSLGVLTAADFGLQGADYAPHLAEVTQLALHPSRERRYVDAPGAKRRGQANRRSSGTHVGSRARNDTGTSRRHNPLVRGREAVRVAGRPGSPDTVFGLASSHGSIPRCEFVKNPENDLTSSQHP